MHFSPPMVLCEELPESEREQAYELHGELHKLDTFLSSFSSALSLFNYASRAIGEATAIREASKLNEHSSNQALNRMASDAHICAIRSYQNTVQFYKGWHEIAVRDAAMSLWNFVIIARRINKLRVACPTLNGFINGRDVEHATQLISKYFPHAEYMRNVIGHQAELNFRGNAISGEQTILGVFVLGPDAEDVIVNCGVVDQTIVCTYKNEVMRYDLSQETFDKLAEIEIKFYECFMAAVAATKQLMISRLTKPAEDVASNNE